MPLVLLDEGFLFLEVSVLVSIGFVGAGNMAEAMLVGLLKSGFEPDNLYVTNRSSEERLLRAKTLGVKTTDKKEIASCDVIVLAVKPQDMGDVLAELSGLLTDKQLVISVAAGVSIGFIQGHLGSSRVIRVMPNTPGKVQKAMIALAGKVSTDDRDIATVIFSSIGKVIWVDEYELDAVTALSGSGPAYVYFFMEGLMEVAKEMGMSSEVANLLIKQTFSGAIAMVEQSDLSLLELRTAVTSPGGTTSEALRVLEEKDFQGVLREAVFAARQRSTELRR